MLHHIAPAAAFLVEITRDSRRLSPETLFVYSPDVSKSSDYLGTPIPTTFYSLFAPFYPQLSLDERSKAELWATYRLSIGHARIGYLLRVPGMYDATAIDLWVYDARRERFAAPIRLAEEYGDGGYYTRLAGWLVDLNGDGQLDLVTRRYRSEADTRDGGRLLWETDSLWVQFSTNSGFTPQQLVRDSTLRARFDPVRWQKRS